MENAVMQSSWIQRLNSSCQTSALEDEEPEPSPVWTHFTKDFSSCSKRLNKARHHTRSSSWPPNERATICSPSPGVKPVEPVDVKEQFLLSGATLGKFREENFCVPFRDGSESNTFKTGNPLSSQNSSHKSVEALVPSSHATRTCDNLRAGASNSKAMRKNPAAQHLGSEFNKESGCLLEVISPRVLGDAPSVPELAHTTPHTRGSSPDAVIRTSLSRALMGASADADERTCTFCPPTKSVYLPTPSKLSMNRPAVAFGDTNNNTNKSPSGMVLNNNRVKVYGKETKTRQNFGFLHVAGQSKKLNLFGANPCIRSGPCSSACPDIVGAGDGGIGSSTASKSIRRTHTVGFGTFATNSGPFVSKEFHNIRSLTKDLGRCDPVMADRLCIPKKGLDTKMPSTRVPSGDFKSCRETSLDEYWVQHFGDSGPAKLFDTSYQKAVPPQEHLIGGCYRSSFNWMENSWKPHEAEKLKLLHPGAHIAPKSNVESSTSWVVPPQTQVSLRSGLSETKQTCLGHSRGASTNKNPLAGTSFLKARQEKSLQGGMRGLASETGKKELEIQACHARSLGFKEYGEM